MKQITARELHTVINKGGNHIVVDVRSPQEHAEYRIDGSENIPLETLANHTDRLRNFDSVYCYCHSGARSQFACSLLARAGINTAVNMSGGVIAWHSQGLPLSG